jgi:hypothetical protein
MMRSIPRPLGIPWRLVGVAVYVGLNLGLIAYFQRLPGLPHADWELWNALADQPMYDTDTLAPFVWSPVAGWIMQVVAEIGVWPWAAVQVGVLFLLRDWRLIALVAVSWGFMDQIASGNTMVFVFVAGVLAFRGSRPAAVVYLALLFLMPRPLQIPLAVWLIWKMPEIRWPALIVFVVHAAVVLASGMAGDWFANMAGHVSPLGNYGPSELIGTAPWLAIGLPLGVWLTWRGHVGWAGLAMSPYWLAGYLIWPLIELRPASPSPSQRGVLLDPDTHGLRRSLDSG